MICLEYVVVSNHVPECIFSSFDVFINDLIYNPFFHRTIYAYRFVWNCITTVQKVLLLFFVVIV